jgi:hypothetical protein
MRWIYFIQYNILWPTNHSKTTLMKYWATIKLHGSKSVEIWFRMIGKEYIHTYIQQVHTLASLWIYCSEAIQANRPLTVPYTILNSSRAFASEQDKGRACNDIDICKLAICLASMHRQGYLKHYNNEVAAILAFGQFEIDI